MQQKACDSRLHQSAPDRRRDDVVVQREMRVSLGSGLSAGQVRAPGDRHERVGGGGGWGMRGLTPGSALCPWQFPLSLSPTGFWSRRLLDLPVQ